MLVCLASSGCGSFAGTATAVGIGTAALLTDYSEPADTSPPEVGYFFQDRGYGTDAYLGPLDVLLNKGFATAQFEGQNRVIWRHEYGWGDLWDSVRQPSRTAEERGWARILMENFVPWGGARWNTWAWYPNYFGHIMEGGIAYRRLAEWLDHQGVPAPRTFAFLTAMGASVINEAYELGPSDPASEGRGSPNTMVDLYFFDPFGALLFSSDRVSAFFARKLNANVWPLQASFQLNDGRLMNNGHHLVLKLPLKMTDRVSLFFKSGVGVELGLTHHLSDGYDLSWGVGAETRRQVIDPRSRIESVGVTPSAGFWLDRDGSLLASVLFDRHTDRRVSLNAYPGLLDWGGGRFGAWLVLDSDHRPSIGLSGSMLLGAGVGFGF